MTSLLLLSNCLDRLTDGRMDKPITLPLLHMRTGDKMEHALAEHWKELRLEPKADTEWLLNRLVDMNIAKFRNFYCFVS